MFKVERAHDLLKELSPLLIAHWEEIGTLKDKIPLSPDFERYLKLQDAGLLLCVSARKEKELIGYSMMFISPSLHYSKNVFAVNDVVYIKPEHRKGFLGIKLMKFVEQELRMIGVSKVYYHIKKEHNWGKIMERLVYIEEEVNNSKIIGE